MNTDELDTPATVTSLEIASAEAAGLFATAHEALSAFAGVPGDAVADPAGAWETLGAAAARLAACGTAGGTSSPMAWRVEHPDFGVAFQLAGPADILELGVSSSGALAHAYGTARSGDQLIVRASGAGWLCVVVGEDPRRRAVLPSGEIHDAGAESLLSRPGAQISDIQDPVEALQRPPPPPRDPYEFPEQKLKDLEALEVTELRHVEDSLARLPRMIEEFKRWKDKLAPQPAKPSAPALARFCFECGAEYRGDARFCAECGKPRRPAGSR